MNRDRNLLFGILAVQIKGVTPKQIVEAGAAWALESSRPIGEFLLRQGALSRADVEFLDHVVDAALKAHQGDAVRALDMLGGDEQVQKTFHGSLIRRPSGGLDTRPMAMDSAFGNPNVILSSLEELPGRYSNISEYGRGGMGRVLLVQDEHMGREVALKELLLPTSEWPGPGDSPIQASTAITARFLQEARLTGKLEHPSIVPVYELGRRSNGTLYYTMKLVRGKTLAKALKETRGLQERLALLTNFVDLCNAIAYAHSRGVIHRDIKPANVMVGAFGETVVLDWGLAKARDIEDIYSKELETTMRNLRMKVKPRPDVTPFETRVGEAVGTPNYMPPEQAEGKIDQITERSDVYSLGVVLYELLSGRVPFEQPSVDQVLWSVINNTPPPIATLEADAPPELIEVCMKAMSKNPAERYPSAAELAEEIRRFLTGSLVQAYKYSPAQILRRYYQRHRVVVNTVAAAAAALLAVGIFSYVNIWNARNEERRQRAVAESALQTAEEARQAEARARADAESHQYDAQLRLTQSYIAEQQMSLANEALDNTPQNPRDWAWGYLKNQANQSLYKVHSDKSILFWAKFEPGGRFLVALRNPEPPGLWDAEGRFVRDLKGTGAIYNNAAFSRDGSRFAAIGEKGLDVWDTGTGELVQELRAETMGYDLLFVPETSKVWASYDSGELVEWDVASGQRLRAIQTGQEAIGGLRLAGNVLLSVSNGGKLQAWGLDTGQSRYERNADMVWPSPDGKAAIVCHENDVELLDAGSGATLQRLDGHERPLLHASFSKDGGRILTASRDGYVRQWERGSSEPLLTFGLVNDLPIVAYFIHEDEQILACGGKNRYSVRDAKTGAELYSFAGTNQAVAIAELSRAGDYLLSCPALHSFEVFDVIQPRFLKAKTLLSSSLAIPAVGGVSLVARDLSADRIAYAVGRNIALLDTGAPALISSFSAPAVVSGLAVSGDGASIAYSAGHAVSVVDAVNVERRRLYDEHQDDVLALGFNTAGDRLASCDASGGLRVWNVKDGQTQWSVTLPSVADDVAFVGGTLVCGSRDGYLRAFDAGTGAPIREVQASDTPIFAVVAPHTEAGKLAILSSNGRISFRNGTDLGEDWSLRMEETYQLQKLPGKIASYTADDRYLSTSMAGLSYTLSIIDTVQRSFRLRLPGATNMVLHNNKTGITLTPEGAIQFNSLAWTGGR